MASGLLPAPRVTVIHHSPDHLPMRTAMNVLGMLLLITGCVWILQGINVLPGSFMTGQTKWAVNGAIAAAVGIVLLVLARRLTT